MFRESRAPQKYFYVRDFLTPCFITLGANNGGAYPSTPRYIVMLAHPHQGYMVLRFARRHPIAKALHQSPNQSRR